MTMFDRDKLLHELLLRTRQKTRSRNTFENNIPTDVKLSKMKVSKTIQSGGFLCTLFSK